MSHVLGSTKGRKEACNYDEEKGGDLLNVMNRKRASRHENTRVGVGELFRKVIKTSRPLTRKKVWNSARNMKG